MADVVDSTPKDQSDPAKKISKLESRRRFKNKLREEVKEKDKCSKTQRKK